MRCHVKSCRHKHTKNVVEQSSSLAMRRKIAYERKGILVVAEDGWISRQPMEAWNVCQNLDFSLWKIASLYVMGSRKTTLSDLCQIYLSFPAVVLDSCLEHPAPSLCLCLPVAGNCRLYSVTHFPAVPPRLYIKFFLSYGAEKQVHVKSGKQILTSTSNIAHQQWFSGAWCWRRVVFTITREEFHDPL